jgi:hypothetical protein
MTLTFDYAKNWLMPTLSKPYETPSFAWVPMYG